MNEEGNEKAEDSGAKTASDNINTRRYLEKFTSLTNINQTLTKRKWKEVKHQLKQKHETRHSIQYVHKNLNLEILETDTAEMLSHLNISRLYH